MNSAILALEDGTVFEGRSFGAPAERSGEVVFNTALTGYQEIFTDPSYSGQIVVLTNPQIGNYGTSRDDNEAGQAVHRRAGGARVLRASPATGAPMTTAERFPGASRHPGRLRSRYARAGPPSAHARRDARRAFVDREAIAAKLVEKARSIPTMAGLDLASRVSTRRALRVDAAGGAVLALRPGRRGRAEPRYHVVAYDFGIKHNILRRLVQVGLPRDGGAGAHLRRRRAGAEAGRRLSLERPRRSGAARDAGRRTSAS